MAYIHAFIEDYDQALATIDRHLALVKFPLMEWECRVSNGFYFYWLGSLRKAEAEFQEADRIEKEKIGGPHPDTLGATSRLFGIMACERGDYKLGRKYLDESLGLWTQYFTASQKETKAGVDFPIALLDIRQGFLDSARMRIEDMKRFVQEGSVVPPDVKVKSENLAGRLSYEHLRLIVLDKAPLLPSAIAYSKNLIDRLNVELLLKEGSFKDAIGLCQKLSLPRTPGLHLPYQLGRYNLDIPRDLLAQAYAKAGELGMAITEYERILTSNLKDPDRRLTDPLCYYRLAKLYEQKGQKAKARARYERFLELWKDADPGTPEVDDAKSRLAAL
jgi:tetratricopeptide (TPR) repeat protein